MFLRRNYNDNLARELLLQLVASKMATVVAALLFMGISAGATAGYAWLAGPLIGSLEEGRAAGSATFVDAPGAGWPYLSWTQIAGLLVLLGILRAVSEAARAHLTASLQLAVTREFRKKILARALYLNPLELGRWPPVSSLPGFRSRCTA